MQRLSPMHLLGAASSDRGWQHISHTHEHSQAGRTAEVGFLACVCEYLSGNMCFNARLRVCKGIQACVCVTEGL